MSLNVVVSHSVNNQTTWLDNPFCSFVIKGSATIVSIEITQPRSQNYPIGIAIFKGVPPLTKATIIPRIIGGKPWHQNKFVGELAGDGQEYTIMSQTFSSSNLGAFEVRVLSDGALEMSAESSCGGKISKGTS